MASATPTVILAILVGSITGLTFPALQSLMSERTGEDAQGELQGAIGSTIGLTAILGPPVMTQIFGYFTDDAGLFFPGAPYVLSILLLLVSATILWTR